MITPRDFCRGAAGAAVEYTARESIIFNNFGELRGTPISLNGRPGTLNGMITPTQARVMYPDTLADVRKDVIDKLSPDVVNRRWPSVVLFRFTYKWTGQEVALDYIRSSFINSPPNSNRSFSNECNRHSRFFFQSHIYSYR